MKVEEGEATNAADMAARWSKWTRCGICDQNYRGVVSCALGWACWKSYVQRPMEGPAKRAALTTLGSGLMDGDRAGEALLQAHQREGLQFMYDCVTGRRRDTSGQPLQGCILAHTMGLGKSLQALALVHTLLRGGPRGAAAPDVELPVDEGPEDLEDGDEVRAVAAEAALGDLPLAGEVRQGRRRAQGPRGAEEADGRAREGGLVGDAAAWAGNG